MQRRPPAPGRPSRLRPSLRIGHGGPTGRSSCRPAALPDCAPTSRAGLSSSRARKHLAALRLGVCCPWIALRQSVVIWATFSSAIAQLAFARLRKLPMPRRDRSIISSSATSPTFQPGERPVPVRPWPAEASAVVHPMVLFAHRAGLLHSSHGAAALAASEGPDHSRPPAPPDHRPPQISERDGTEAAGLSQAKILHLPFEIGQRIVRMRIEPAAIIQQLGRRPGSRGTPRLVERAHRARAARGSGR